MGVLIKPNGSELEIKPANGKTFSLQELQEAVGGYIEVITLPNGRPIIINEEGKLLNLARNKRATLLGKLCGIHNNDYIAGNALLCNKDEIE